MVQTNMGVYIQNSNGEERKRVKVVNRDPDNLLVQWVPGGKTITEILKEMNNGCAQFCILRLVNINNTKTIRSYLQLTEKKNFPSHLRKCKDMELK